MALKYILVFICFTLTTVFNFNYLTFNSKDEINLNYTKPTLQGSLKQDLEYVEDIKKDGILTACLLLARNNIVGNNIHVNTAIQNTKFDKTKVFDKILVIMIKNCVKKLDEKFVDEVLSVENIVKYGNKHEKLLTFEKAELEKEPVFDASENQLLDIIYKSDAIKEEPKQIKDKKVIKEKITLKEDTLYNVMSQLESTQSRYIIVGILISFVVSFLMWQIYNSFFGKKQIAQSQNKNKKNN